MSEPRVFSPTDMGNAERFTAMHGAKVRYVHAHGWYAWTGTHWTADTTGIVPRYAKQVPRAMLREAATSSDATERKVLAEWAVKTESAARLEAMIRLAASELPIATTIDAFDRDPWLLNVQNGTLDLRTRELRPHCPTDLITKICPVAFDPLAKAPTFQKFIYRIFDGNDEPILFVQQLLGMCLTGDIREQILPIWWGEGANGKSTLLGIVSYLMGDYAGTAPESLLAISRRDEHPTELADLQGKRLVVASETEQQGRLKIQLVKRLTGDGTIKARRMRQDFYEFARTHKTIMMTNNRPVVREDTEAVWRRLKLVPFNVIIPQAERDPLLLDKLKLEAAGALAWLVQGCLSWQTHGLREPQVVKAATASYREESDPVGEFIEAYCTTGSGLFVRSSDLRQAYEGFCVERGDRPVGGRTFTNRLEHAGCKAVPKYLGGQTVRCWVGIGLVNAMQLEEEVV